jgi:tRNA threonylcarbamoyladenosine biosynthesis protein TsaB
MKILALEFSSPQRSVAVVVPGTSSKRVEHEAIEAGADPNKPFEMIESVLKQAQIDRGEIEGLAIGLGPGSYTGIRSAIAMAQGWQLARSVNLQGVSSVECMAAQAHDEGIRGRVSIVVDAQRGEFYFAPYQLDTEWRELSPLRLVPRQEIEAQQAKGDLLVGPEIQNWFPQGRAVFPRAATLGKLAMNRANYLGGEQIEPIYLRPSAFLKAPPPRILPDGSAI